MKKPSRLAVNEYHIINIDRDGNKQILATHTAPLPV